MKKLKTKLNNLSESQEYLYKNFLYCGICNKKIKLLNDIYSCKEGCVSLDIFTLSTIIIERILKDIALGKIEENLTLKINILSSKLAEDKKRLYFNEEQVRKYFNAYINSPNNKHFKYKFSNYKKEESQLKASINILRTRLRLLDYKLRTQKVFELELRGLINSGKEHFNNNWIIIDEYVKKFINKVVLKKYLNEAGYSVEVSYSKD